MTVGAQDADLPFNLTALDRQILAQTDGEFHPHSWEELKQIIGKSLMQGTNAGCLPSPHLSDCWSSM